MSAEIDWEKLAVDLGLLTAQGEHSGSGEARRALEIILGEDALRAAVDYYVAHGRGGELARSVLWQLRPWSAMSRCYEIYKQANTMDARRTSVELLRVVADRRAVPWITEFLEDGDAEVQAWGAGVLDQLLWSELIEPDEVEDLLRTAEHHQNEAVRERAEFIRSYLNAREEAAKHSGPDGMCGGGSAQE
jgi:hypothetical protein